MKLDKKILTTLAAGAITTFAPADTIIADSADAEARSNGGSAQAVRDFLFAGTYYGGTGLAPVFPFQLPTLEEGESFDTATLSIGLIALSRAGNLAAEEVNGNIVGLDRVNTSPTLDGADWENPGEILHEDFYTPLSQPGAQTSNDFAAWLNTQYADGANAGSYVFIRVDTEGLTTGRSAYQIASSENTTAQVPTIDFTATTDPSASRELAITDIVYNLEANTVTLTWNKSRALSYIATSSLDLIDWVNELDDSIDDSKDEIPDDGNLLTVTFPLVGLEGQDRLFFRIEEE